MSKTIKSVPTVKTVTNLEACDCRWPIGDPRDANFHFCGARAEPGKPYCTEHWNVSFVAARPRGVPANSHAQLPIVKAA